MSVSSTPCSHCNAPVLYDPASVAPIAACPACGGRVTVAAASTPPASGRVTVTVNGRPIHVVGVRPSPLWMLAAAVAVAAGLALAVLFAAVVAGITLVVVALLVVAGGIGRIRRAVGGGTAVAGRQREMKG